MRQARRTAKLQRLHLAIQLDEFYRRMNFSHWREPIARKKSFSDIRQYRHDHKVDDFMAVLRESEIPIK